MQYVNAPLKLAILETVGTQVALSFETGIPETRLSKIVRRRLSPSTVERRRIARALGKSEDAIFGPTTPAESEACFEAAELQALAEVQRL